MTRSYSTGQVPAVPDISMPATAQTVTTVIIAVVAAVAFLAAGAIGRRHGTPLYLMVLLGGAVASFNEPIADLLGGCLHPQSDGWTVFETFDRPIPVWVVLAYALFFGAVPLIVLALMRGGNPRTRLLQSVAVIFAANLLIEMPVLNADVYVYYGEQPFKVLDLFPLHWLFVNATGVATIAVVLYRFGDRFRGANQLWFLAIPGTAQVAALSVGLPAFSFYNTDVAEPWKWVASVATMVIGVAALHALSRIVPDREPTRTPAAVEPAPAKAVVAGS